MIWPWGHNTRYWIVHWWVYSWIWCWELKPFWKIWITVGMAEICPSSSCDCSSLCHAPLVGFSWLWTKTSTNEAKICVLYFNSVCQIFCPNKNKVAQVIENVCQPTRFPFVLSYFFSIFHVNFKNFSLKTNTFFFSLKIFISI